MKMFKTAGVFGVLAFAGLAGASSNTQYILVDVPFAFVVAGQNSQPGEYRVNQDDNGVLTLQGNGKAVTVITTPDNSGQNVKKTSLRFTSAANREYLVGIGVEGSGSRALTVRAEDEREPALLH